METQDHETFIMQQRIKLWCDVYASVASHNEERTGSICAKSTIAADDAVSVFNRRFNLTDDKTQPLS